MTPKVGRAVDCAGGRASERGGDISSRTAEPDCDFFARRAGPMFDADVGNRFVEHILRRGPTPEPNLVDQSAHRNR